MGFDFSPFQIYDPPAPRRLHPLRNLLMFAWFKNLPDAVKTPLYAGLRLLLTAIIAYFAAMHGLPAPVTNNTVVVSPDADPGFLAAQGAAPKAAGGLHPQAHRFVRAHLVLALMERDKIGVATAYAKMRKVSREDLEDALTTAAVQQGVYGQLGDGTLLQKIIDFLNSPGGQALIKLLLSLLAFADAHEFPTIPAEVLPDGIRVAQVPYPLAWARADFALAG